MERIGKCSLAGGGVSLGEGVEISKDSLASVFALPSWIPTL